MSGPGEVLLINKAIDQAQTLIDLGRYEQAIPVLSKALAQAPDDDWLHCRMADVYFFMDQYEHALRYAKKALGLNPNNTHALFRLAWVYLATNHYDSALETAESAARLEPDDASILYTLAWAQYHSGKLNQALESGKRAIKLDPENAEMHGLVADLSYNKSEFAQAEKHYREALGHDPENASIHCHLGDSLAAQHKTFDATEHMLAAVKLKPAEEMYRNKLFDIVHHEIMDQGLQNRDKILKALDPAVQYFYKDQLGRKGWFEKLRIGSIATLWTLGLGVLMLFFTWVTGDDPSKMLRFVVVVGFIYMVLFIMKRLLAFFRSRNKQE